MASSDPSSRFQRTLVDHTPTPSDAPELLAQSAVAQSGAAQSGQAHRFSIRGLLGQGATSHVYSALDHDLERDVAVKVLRLSDDDQKRLKFLHEARTTAQLEHPNIPPVYDIGLTANRDLYLAIRQIVGNSLRDLLESRRRAGHDSVMPVNDLVTIFIKMCDALAFAHAHGILHQDIKPENVMIGNFGGVVVVDWGTSTPTHSQREGVIVGTPMYMSPEQARAEAPSPANDVYAVGASLFHCLLMRPPLAPHDPSTFWDHKKQGIIDHPTIAERRRLPRALLAIAEKAMAPSRADRYPDILALSHDLRQFQAGLSVSAVSEFILVRLFKWCRRYWKILSPAAALLAIILGLVSYIWNEYRKELAVWGPPILVERFAHGVWDEHWGIVGPGSFTVTDGTLITAGDKDNVLIYKKRLHGPVAIEFEAMILPDHPPGDISAVWSESDIWTTTYPGFSEGKSRTFRFQIAAYDNLFSAIYRDPGSLRTTLHNGPVPVGTWHTIRAEIDQDLVSLRLDGVLLGTHHEVFPCGSGYIGIFGYHHGKAFRNIRIWEKHVAEKVDITRVGDAFLAVSDFANAAVQFHRISESHPDTPIAEEARFKEGFALSSAGEHRRAEQVWSSLADPRNRARADILLLREYIRTEQMPEFFQRFWKLYHAWPDLQPQMRQLWSEILMERLYLGPTGLDALLELRRALFPNDENATHSAGHALFQLGRYDQILQEIPDDPVQTINALFASGRVREAQRRYPEVAFVQKTAQQMLGDFSGFLAHNPDHVETKLLGSGIDTLLAQPNPPPLVLLYAGRAREAIPHLGEDKRLRNAAARLLMDPTLVEGIPLTLDTLFARETDLERLLKRYPDPSSRFRSYAFHALLARIHLDETTFGHLQTQAEMLPYNHMRQPQWFERRLLFPLLQAWQGDPAPLHKALQAALMAEEAAQRPRFVAQRFLGTISDDDFLRQPCSIEAPAWRLVCDGLRQDLAQDPAARVTLQTFLDLPPHRRCLDGIEGNATIERLIRWRLSAGSH